MGVLEPVSDLLFGDTGETKYKVDPYQREYTGSMQTGIRKGLTQVGKREEIEAEKTKFRGVGAGTRERLEEEYGRDRQAAPQAQWENYRVGVEPIPTKQFQGARLNRAGFERQMQGFGRQAAATGKTRRQQIADLGLVRSAALGLAPSVAEMQLQRGLEQSISAQAAAAASARGGLGAQQAAQRQAAIQGAETRALANQQAAALRAGEMAQARQNLLAGGQALRGADIEQQGVLLNAAQTALQPDLAQAQFVQQAENLRSQQAMQTQALGAQAGLQQQNIGAQMAQANMNAQLQQNALNNQYALGLLGQMGQLDQLTLTALRNETARDVGASQFKSQQQLAYDQMMQNAYFQMHGINAGIAQSNAAAGAQNLDRMLGLGSAGLSALGVF